MLLPHEPGLLRRRAYGEYIRSLHSQTIRTPLNRTQTHLTNTFSDARMRVLGRGVNVDDWTYERLMDLPIMTKSLQISELLRVSQVQIAEKSDLGQLCAICLEDIRPSKDIIRKLECMHSFHIMCIDKWFKDNHNCPLCKKSFRNY